MNVISRKKLKDFYLSGSRIRQYATTSENWFRIARKAHWRHFQDVKATFGQTDVATGDTGRTATIFDLGGNKYRILAHIDYMRQTVKIEAVLDHKEYDRKQWTKLF